MSHKVDRYSSQQLVTNKNEVSGLTCWKTMSWKMASLGSFYPATQLSNEER